MKFNSYLDRKYSFKYINVKGERELLSKLAIKLEREKAALKLVENVLNLSVEAQKTVETTVEELKKSVRNYNRVRTILLNSVEVNDIRIVKNEFPEVYEVIGESLLTK